MNFFRYIFVASAALFGLSSCQQEDILKGDVRDADDAITFSTSVPDAISTRAGEGDSGSDPSAYYPLTADKLGEFYVTSFLGKQSADQLYFSNTRFFDSNGVINGKKLFSSFPSHPWPVAPIEFYAYYPSVPTLREYARIGANDDNADNPYFLLSNESDGYKLKNFRISSDMRKKVDFITATARKDYDEVAQKADNKDSIQNLEFDHQLCRVEFKAFSDNDAYDYEIMGIRLGNQAMEADYNFNGSDEVIKGENKPYSVKNKQWENIQPSRFEYIFKPGETVAVLPKKTSDAEHAGQIGVATWEEILIYA